MVAEYKEDDNQKNSKKAAADKKHDGHTDSNPEKNETNHPLHSGLLLSLWDVILYAPGVWICYAVSGSREKFWLSAKKLFSFLEK